MFFSSLQDSARILVYYWKLYQIYFAGWGEDLIHPVVYP